jgi:hypothetical protein
MNLTPHTAPKMVRAPRYRHKVASFRKNSMERLDIVIEEYNGLQIKQLPQLIDALKEAEQLAIKRGLLGRPSEQGIYRNG